RTGGRRESWCREVMGVRSESAVRIPHAATPEIPEELSRRVVIDRIRPDVDEGRFPIKRTVGEEVQLSADIFADGHDAIAAVIQHGDDEIPMALAVEGTDEWTASFTVSARVGWDEYRIVAWVDRFLTWRRDLLKKYAAGQDVGVELLEGSMLVRDAAARGGDERLLAAADALTDTTPVEQRVAHAMDADLADAMARHADRSHATVSPPRRVWVDRERARFGAWYEMFPRSAGADTHRSGTFREAAADLVRIADMGFDVVYLPPIHPIGVSFRKGRNNTLSAGPDDPGSPWAIGSDAGGHTAVDPGLGTIDDFVAFRAEAERHGLEVALDLAWQCSPDHPWVTEHPEWFRHRPDGTIKYAENPPKKYQDIYPLDFENDD